MKSTILTGNCSKPFKKYQVRETWTCRFTFELFGCSIVTPRPVSRLRIDDSLIMPGHASKGSCADDTCVNYASSSWGASKIVSSSAQFYQTFGLNYFYILLLCSSIFCLYKNMVQSMHSGVAAISQPSNTLQRSMTYSKPSPIQNKKNSAKGDFVLTLCQQTSM